MANVDRFNPCTHTVFGVLNHFQECHLLLWLKVLRTAALQDLAPSVLSHILHPSLQPHVSFLTCHLCTSMLIFFLPQGLCTCHCLPTTLLWFPQAGSLSISSQRPSYEKQVPQPPPSNYFLLSLPWPPWCLLRPILILLISWLTYSVSFHQNGSSRRAGTLSVPSVPSTGKICTESTQEILVEGSNELGNLWAPISKVIKK